MEIDLKSIPDLKEKLKEERESLEEKYKQKEEERSKFESYKLYEAEDEVCQPQRYSVCCTCRRQRGRGGQDYAQGHGHR